MPRDIGEWVVTYHDKKGRRLNENGEVRWGKTKKD
jgi:hypothetical protein